MTLLSLRKSPVRSLFLMVLLALFVGGFSAPTVQGQNMTQVYEITPKQGAESGLEAAMREHANWREEHGDPWGWNVYRVVQGKNYGSYIVRSPGHSWEDFDEYSQGFGPKGARHYRATVAPMVESFEASIVKRDTSVTHLPDDMSGYNLWDVTTYRLKPGHRQEFVSAVEKATKALMQETEDRYGAWIRVVSGAEAGSVRLAVPRAGWADFKAPSPSNREIYAEAFGEEQTQQMYERFSNAYRSSYNLVARYRPDLSVEGQE